jgi:hypothetical protein
VTTLPNLSLITEAAKIADMVSIYFKGVCGGNNFSRARLKEDGLSDGKTEASGSKRVDILWITKPSQSL